MLKITLVSITFRTLNNIAPVAQTLASRGARCQVIWAPTSQRIEGQTPADFGLPVALDFSGMNASDPAVLRRLRGTCGDWLHSEEPDLVLSDDMTTWPNRLVYELVRALPSRPWHVAWQHGFHQPWYELRERFDADFFACYGRLHAFLMGEALAGRVLPAGLPKLDRLAEPFESRGGYLSWFAQPQPAAARQVEFLSEVAKVTGRPVRIRPHPAAPDAFGAFTDLIDRGLELEDPAGDPIQTLRRCQGFLSTHSSAAIEALLLQKSAILFPSFGLTSFAGYPNVASELSARAYQVAVGRIPSRRQATEAFLDDCIGGRRFDHTARGVALLERLAARRAAGHPPGALAPHEAASLLAPA